MRRATIPAAGLAFAACLALVLFGGVMSGLAQENSADDLAAWRAAPPRNAGDSRADYLDAARGAIGAGMPKTEVAAALGNPNYDYGVEWVYEVAFDWSWRDADYLVISFDGSENVSGVRVTTESTYEDPSEQR